MHRSRLGGLSIDCQTEDLAAAADFWGAALGLEVRPSTAPEDENYVAFDTAANDLDIEVQQVDHPSRVHIDIESDDIEAEVRRLEKLGATRVGQVRDWVVMQAPTGHRFCVVPVQHANFQREAKVWE